MELFRKKDSKFYWYDFKVRGKRYRRSTKETNKKRAEKIAAIKLSQAMGGTGLLDRRAPSLQGFSTGFLNWVNGGDIDPLIRLGPCETSPTRKQQFALRNWSLACTREKNIFKHSRPASIGKLATINIRILIEPTVQPVTCQAQHKRSVTWLDMDRARRDSMRSLR